METSATLLPSDAIPAPVLPMWRCTTEKYLRMIDTGVFDDQRVELIEGYLSAMAPAGPDHSGATYDFIEAFLPVAKRFKVCVQGTVVIGEGNVFDPDFALLRRKPGGYRESHARAEDILLIVEVSHSSLARDRDAKLPIYAAAGIQEYWIAELQQKALHVYREPAGALYKQLQTLTGDQTIRPLACEDLEVRAGDLFG
ncbi:hypothetical protein Pla175_07080 [Pirellulimonas nuda]|uniref:Putative restriction endonuclease domain-containing protein n=1 Tax=Pirellulimonas nuda TaxID=2528009 RepID=A0A518D7C7_9BACT|nr:Uma2 family endonuclease [Pirellulimonas nuda]QDU87349.1 hypothetical protein Pla175_07080 [Pirellulimonas nuda]